MALSDNAKEAIRRAVTEDKAADEISAAIDSNGSGPAADPADLAASTALPTPAAIAASYADLAAARTSVNALRSDVVAIQSGAEVRLDAVEAKINALLDALRAAGMIA